MCVFILSPDYHGFSSRELLGSLGFGSDERRMDPCVGIFVLFCFTWCFGGIGNRHGRTGLFLSSYQPIPDCIHLHVLELGVGEHWSWS